jgi:hypothetical protein
MVPTANAENPKSKDLANPWISVFTYPGLKDNSASDFTQYP